MLKKMIGGVVAMATAVVLAPAGAAAADEAPGVSDGGRPGPARLYAADVDLGALRPSDFAGFTPADFQGLPERVRDAALVPVAEVTTEYAVTDALDANRNPLATSELCLTQWRNTYRKSFVGLTLMTVSNKMYGCSDGIYFTETPIDLSSGRGSYGYVFTGWRDSAVGFCSSSRLKWVQVKTGKFKYGLSSDLFYLSNNTVFYGGGGQVAGGC